MDNKFHKISPNEDWSDYTFVFACVSVGNIGQLAVDLLISTFVTNTKKAGYLFSDLIEPMAGPDPYVQDSQEISISCERMPNHEHASCISRMVFSCLFLYCFF